MHKRRVLGGCKEFFDIVGERVGGVGKLLFVLFGKVVFGKVYVRFDQRGHVEKPVGNAGDAPAKLARKLFLRRLQRAFAARADYESHRLRLREVELVVHERPTRKFARLRGSCAARKEVVENFPRDERVAVARDFEHVLARIGRRFFE